MTLTSMKVHSAEDAVSAAVWRSPSLACRSPGSCRTETRRIRRRGGRRTPNARGKKLEELPASSRRCSCQTAARPSFHARLVRLVTLRVYFRVFARHDAVGIDRNDCGLTTAVARVSSRVARICLTGRPAILPCRFASSPIRWHEPGTIPKRLAAATAVGEGRER